MNLSFSDKVKGTEDGSIFAVLNEKKNEMLAQGRTIYNLLAEYCLGFAAIVVRFVKRIFATTVYCCQ